MSAAGTWQFTIATPFGKQEVEYLFITENETLTGQATQGSDTTALIDLALEGSRLTWTQHVTRPMKLKLQFDVMLEGDTLTGTAKANPLPASKVSGVRVRSDIPATLPA